MKITVEHDDGRSAVFEGRKAELIASGITSLWDNFLEQEQETKEAFDKLNTAWSSSPVRMQPSQGCDASSNLVQAICPHCGDRIGPDDEVVTTSGLPVSPDDFTVCLTCREIIRFNNQLQLKRLNCQDWLDLFEERDLFVAMLRFRMRILVDQLKEQKFGHSIDGISRSW